MSTLFEAPNPTHMMNTILIVEDDPCTRMTYCARLQAEGFAAEALGDGRAAIERLKSNPPDLLLLDLMLPQVCGIDVLKFLRAQESTKDLPVIVLSNAYERSITDAARAAGANLCVCKTDCNPKNLVNEVRALLAATSTESNLVVKTRVTTALSKQPISEPGVDRETAGEMLARIASLRRLSQHLGTGDEAGRMGRLLELRRAVHGVAGGAALAGLTDLARMSCALEALLNELHTKPQKLNPSTLRTTAQAIDLLAALARNASAPEITSDAPRILVVDDEPISRQIVCTALKQANLAATAVGDPLDALKLLAVNHFDLILLDVEMPGLNGFDVCRKLRATPLNAKTPVVFVTALTDFETRAHSNLSGGTDIIAKPVLLIELAVKALIHLLRARLTPDTAKANSAERQPPRSVQHHYPETCLVPA